MWTRYFIAMGLILAVAAVWISIQYLYRWFALRHPEFGPIREVLGCGMACTCDEPCEERKKKLSNDQTMKE